jgi:hypothetical protein
MLDSKPGVYTYYKAFLHKDKNILKKLLKGTQTKRPCEVQNAILKRHLLELTQSFMIPLERYMASLMPLQKNISPYKVFLTYLVKPILVVHISINKVLLLGFRQHLHLDPSIPMISLPH